ncbi:MAG: DUF1456 family protein [Desulfamplus sp.]|nr:DUF1456 family protein [Desulfamplus sp.]
MENNDVLRMFRYALNIPDLTMLNIFKIAECKIDGPQLLNLLKKRDDEGYAACSTALLERFFNGLIIYNRGRQGYETSESNEKSMERGKFTDSKPTLKTEREASDGKNSQPKPPEILSNNTILKKIRIALDLKQEEMMEIFRLGKVNMTKGEFTALFRKEGHKNYKECGDQYLKKFLQGLAARHRS